MDEKTKKDHLNFKHQGKEEQYQKKCILCDRKVKAGNTRSNNGDLDVKVIDKVKLNDKFGK